MRLILRTPEERTRHARLQQPGASGARPQRTALLAMALVLGFAASAMPARALDPEDSTAVARALQAATGQAFNPQAVCGRAARDLPDVVALGGHVHDVGCVVVAVSVADRPLTLAAGWALVMARSGWAQAVPAARERLALAWARGVLLAFQPPLDRAPAAFARPNARPFTPPTAAAQADGSVRVDVWIQDPPGMQAETVFTRVAFTFSASGEIGRRERLDGFAVPIAR